MTSDRFDSNIKLNNPAFIHDTVQMYGKIEIEDSSSIWPNVVIRAEMFDVKIGSYTNIQDFSMIHIGARTGTKIGNYCSITHHCTIHGCTIGNNCLIGINATIMDGVVVGDNSIVAGGAFISEGTIVPENSIVMGIPAKVRSTKNNFISNRFNAFMYYYNATCYSSGNYRGWQGKEFERVAQNEMEKITKDFNLLYS